MAARREPSAPPDLPGYSYVRLLGMGGYADVFLYEQQMPRRPVAVKVLLDGAITDGVRHEFTAEANAMASVGDHPHIVAILTTMTAPDGRPCLVMELYDGQNYSLRSRSETLSVPECLRVGVQIACAVETAHRAGILHRDIKPANILTNKYARPALTDFGIAGTTQPGQSDDLVGLSVPWSPPEVVMARAPADFRSDVYSLGATVYSLLAGRSPFEVAGQPVRLNELMSRIDRLPVPPIERADVPEVLQRALAQAMAKDPGARPPTAVAFAKVLQGIEAELGYAVTELDLYDPQLRVSNPVAAADDDSAHTTVAHVDDDPTRLSGFRVIDPHAGRPDDEAFAAELTSRAPHGAAPGVIDRIPSHPTSAPAPGPPIPASGRWERPAGVGGGTPEPSAAGGDNASPSSGPPPVAGRTWSRRGLAAGAAGLVATLVAVGVAVIALGGGCDPADASCSTTTTTTAVAVDGGDAAPEAPISVAVSRGTGAEFTVSLVNPSPAAGDRAVVMARNDTAPLLDAEGQQVRLEAAAESSDAVSVPVSASDVTRLCVDVRIVRANLQASPVTEACDDGVVVISDP